MRVAVLAGAGIGGTEKAAVGYATELAKGGFDVSYLAPAGPRTLDFPQFGIRLVDLAHERLTLGQFLRSSRPDVLHQHVPGYAFENPVYPVLRELGASAPCLVETNVFGRLEDPAGDPFVKHRTFISQASAVQAFLRSGRRWDRDSLAGCTAIYYPVAPDSALDLATRETTRVELGIAPGELLAIRIGQPSADKWTRWEADAFLRARRQVPQLRLLLMEPPARIRAALAALGPASGILLRDASSDFAWLRRIYAAADVMIHASNFGESFGYTLAEGMQSALPLVVRSTPWGDNAQVELVDNAVTGFVCATVQEMSRRLVQLAGDPQLRRSMGRAGRARIAGLADAAREARVLRAVIEYAVTGQRSPILDERRESLLAFRQDFLRRERVFSESLAARPLEWLQWHSYHAYRKLRTAAGKVRARPRIR